MLREGAELLCIVQLNRDDGWEGLGPQWAGVALDQHLALGTCSLSQMLEHLAQKRSSPEEQGLLGGPEAALCLVRSGSSPMLSGNLPAAPVSFQSLSGSLLPSFYGMVYVCSSALELLGSCWSLSVLSWAAIVALFIPIRSRDPGGYKTAVRVCGVIGS